MQNSQGLNCGLIRCFRFCALAFLHRLKKRIGASTRMRVTSNQSLKSSRSTPVSLRQSEQTLSRRHTQAPPCCFCHCALQLCSSSCSWFNSPGYRHPQSSLGRAYMDVPLLLPPDPQQLPHHHWRRFCHYLGNEPRMGGLALPLSRGNPLLCCVEPHVLQNCNRNLTQRTAFLSEITPILRQSVSFWTFWTSDPRFSGISCSALRGISSRFRIYPFTRQ